MEKYLNNDSYVKISNGYIYCDGAGNLYNYRERFDNIVEKVVLDFVDYNIINMISFIGNKITILSSNNKKMEIDYKLSEKLNNYINYRFEEDRNSTILNNEFCCLSFSSSNIYKSYKATRGNGFVILMTNNDGIITRSDIKFIYDYYDKYFDKSYTLTKDEDSDEIIISSGEYQMILDTDIYNELEKYIKEKNGYKKILK